MARGKARPAGDSKPPRPLKARLQRPVIARSFLGGDVLDDPHHHEQNHRADKGQDDRAENAATQGERDPEIGKQEACDQRAENADDDIADKAESRRIGLV